MVIIVCMLYRLWRILDILSILVVLLIAGNGGSVPQLNDETDQVRVYTRQIEFDYPTWVWDATWTKFKQAGIDSPYLFNYATSKQVVSEYLRTTGDLMQTENRIEQIYSDPSVTDKDGASAFLRKQRDDLTQRQNELAPFAESILQTQLSEALSQLGLTTGGQPLPPVLFHNTPTPLALIVSPRDKIEQIANISLLPTLTINDQIQLEDKVAKSLDVSTLVVPIGGVGVYPTMVMETTDLSWVLDTIAHEWTHNYLNVRPLGLNYNTTPELRTMNETTASISGNEIGTYVLQHYYPELAASSSTQNPLSLNTASLPSNQPGNPPPAFDFRAEMHQTRVTADKLLAEGKIDEAESYMEQRRQLFWDHGYLIRKLNQAYFAFYGAYADVPGGAAGEDPVGPAVRALRAQSASLAGFINTIAWMTSFQQLQQAVQK